MVSQPATQVRSRPSSAYAALDRLTEVLLYFGIIFAPWAFGATQQWSMWVMNIVGYMLGLLWLGKRALAVFGGFTPPRWTNINIKPNCWTGKPRTSVVARALTVLMGVLTILLLAYALVAAVNARAVVVRPSWTLQYRDCIRWLPHSYDQAASWFAFWSYLALALTFWAAWDWLRGLTDLEELEVKAARESSDPSDASDPFELLKGPYRVPGRVKRLLMVLCLNGALLAAQGIVQRLSGSNRLLWIIEPSINKDAQSQFGPFAYRSNAAQYLNLLWPVCAGLAWLLARGKRHALRHGLHWTGLGAGWLVASVVLMASAPFVSLSRGGVLVAVALILLVAVVMTIANRGRQWRIHLGLVLLTLMVAEIGIVLGFDNLMMRFETFFIDNLSGRLETYENAKQMIREHPWLGTGPGSFPALYQFYRQDYSPAWEAYAHNDWMELRITFGLIGFGLILLLLCAVPLRWWFGDGPAVHWVLPVSVLLSMAGCLAHARFDLPFCVYSISWTFLVLCAVLVAMGKPRGTGPRICS